MPSLMVDRSRTRVAFVYKNFGAMKGLSHIGLGVSAMQNVRMLRDHGIIADVWAISSVLDLEKRLDEEAQATHFAHHVPVSHVVISAPWIETPPLQKLLAMHSRIQFVVVSHSNIGFLQADPRAIRLLREDSELERAYANFHIAGNSHNLVEWWKKTYHTAMWHLPNMYPLREDVDIRPRMYRSGSTLRIGCFCAVRPYKNVLTAGGAALEIAMRLGVADMEFWISGGRVEGGAQTIRESLTQMYAGLHHVEIKVNNWESWPMFTQTVHLMDLLLQPSYTEGFNMVTADGIVQGVPSVCSEAIDWVPRRWHAQADNASDIADVGISLIHDPNAAYEGRRALIQHNEHALRHWMDFLRCR
jgi:hypothetical protein